MHSTNKKVVGKKFIPPLKKVAISWKLSPLTSNTAVKVADTECNKRIKKISVQIYLLVKPEVYNFIILNFPFAREHVSSSQYITYIAYI